MTASQLQALGQPAPSRLALARDVLASEWTKLRSLRSNRWTLGIAVVVTLVLTGVVAESFAAAPGTGQRAAPVDRIASSFLAYAEYTVQPVTVLSVLVFTSEYGSGLIRTTFTAVPRRRTVLAAKAAVTVVYLLAAACMALPAPWNIRLGRFTLPLAAYDEVAVHPAAGLLSPGLSLLVLIAWPAAALLAAGFVLTRRDV